MNARTALLLSIPLFLGPLTGCASLDPEPASREAEAAGVVGSYGPWTPIASLELQATGEYECLVLAWVTADGCGTVEGNGTSCGSWRLSGGEIQFLPIAEARDLVLTFTGATAVPTKEGLLLTLEGQDYPLPRQ